MIDIDWWETVFVTEEGYCGVTDPYFVDSEWLHVIDVYDDFGGYWVEGACW